MFGLTPYRRRMFPNYWFRDFFNEDFTGQMSTIRADIYEDGNNLVIEAEVPGFNKDEVKVEVHGDQLTISAQRDQDTEEKSDNYIRRERSVNQVCRTFVIEDLDADKIEAKFENGLLRLTVPKPEKLLPKSRQIDIN